jgi:hypothetical protein
MIPDKEDVFALQVAGEFLHADEKHEQGKGENPGKSIPCQSAP